MDQTVDVDIVTVAFVGIHIRLDDLSCGKRTDGKCDILCMQRHGCTFKRGVRKLSCNTDGIERSTAAEFFDVTDVACGKTVGDSRTDIADTAVPESCRNAGFDAHAVGHNADPVTGDFMVVACGSTVTAVMDELEDAFLRFNIAETDDGHRFVLGTPEVLSEAGFSVDGDLAAVDTDLRFSANNSKFRRLHRSKRFLCRFDSTGDQNTFQIRTVNITPACLTGAVGGGMGVRGGCKDIFKRNVACLCNGLSGLCTACRAKVCERKGHHQNGSGITAAECECFDFKVIVAGGGVGIVVVAVEHTADFGCCVSPSGACK